MRRRIAEQFALDQALGNRRAIDGDERLLRALAREVQGPRERLLARAGRTHDHDGDAAVGDAPRIAQVAQHLRIVAGEVLEPHGGVRIPGATRTTALARRAPGMAARCGRRARSRHASVALDQAREVAPSELVVPQFPHGAPAGERGREQLLVARVEHLGDRAADQFACDPARRAASAPSHRRRRWYRRRPPRSRRRATDRRTRAGVEPQHRLAFDGGARTGTSR